MARAADDEEDASKNKCFLGCIYAGRHRTVTDSNEAKIKTA